MQIPQLRIGHLTLHMPVVQGGMGVGISLSGLASAVARAGGLGVIAGAEIGFNTPMYHTNKIIANLEALRFHIRRARELAPGGAIGVNLMVAINNYDEMVQAAVEEEVDIIFSGAGLPLHLPKLTMGSKTMISPIVSSGRGAEIICRQWERKYQYIPDAVVVEGPLAGGHLGFSFEELSGKLPSLESLTEEVKSALLPYEIKYGKEIPVIAGGGIISGEQIGRLLEHGANAAQIATLFALTTECDASDAWKNELLRATKDDIIIIKSPVGMPGRAVRNHFLEEMESGLRRPIRCGMNCLKPCSPQKAPYCIADALINAQQGHLEGGFAFSGANAYLLHEIRSVKDVMNQLRVELLEYEPELILL